MTTVFLRVLKADDKGAALLEAVNEPDHSCGTARFEVDPRSFASVPRSPFAYWVSDRLRALFNDLPPFEAEGRTVKQGLATADDFRFVRAWWEVPSESIGRRWFPFAKGGRFSRFYADVCPVVNWEREGAEIKNNLNASGGIRSNVWMLRDTASNFFFRPGLTWPLRGIRFSAQAVPPGCVFSVGGKMAFADLDELPWFLALFNSRAFDSFIAFFAGKIGGVQYEVGLVQSVPVPNTERSWTSAVAELASRGWSLEHWLDTRSETSHAFVLPAVLQVKGPDLAARVASYLHRVRETEDELTHVQSEIDERCFELYGIDEADRRAISEGFGPKTAEAKAIEAEGDQEGELLERAEETASHVKLATLAAEFVSWAVGVACGRFDVHPAIDAREFPPEPGSFDPVPIFSPGMLSEKDGLPLADCPDSYPIAFPESGVLVDDDGDSRDLTAAVRTVFDTVFGNQADRWWTDIATLLDDKGRGLREWLGERFFEYHIKQYSKSRRRAPIVWQLGTQSGRFSIWLFAHRLTPDSMFQIQSGVVEPKLAFEERALTRLVQTAGGSPSASERAEIARQAAFVEELRTMLDEVKCVAPLWYPNLDDGVVLTMAPLWRLVPQHKSWQRELKGRWDELAAGKYDWSHIAMHLWPDRVVPKCADDRSLAMAHGLEEEFWAEDSSGKWASRQVDGATVERLVQERSSAAVKAALADLLTAG